METNIGITCRLTKIGRLLFVAVTGDIDHHSAEAIRTKVDRAFDVHDCVGIVFDFEHVAFMDSSGIGMVVCRYKMARERRGLDGCIYIINESEDMKRLLDISGIGKIALRGSQLPEMETL